MGTKIKLHLHTPQNMELDLNELTWLLHTLGDVYDVTMTTIDCTCTVYEINLEKRSTAFDNVIPDEGDGNG